MKCSINGKINIKKMIGNIVIALMIMMFFRIVTVFELAKEEVKTYNILIQEQDTLWDIAGNISKEENIEIQKVIYDIKNINQMKSSTIYQGQTLLIPIYE